MAPEALNKANIDNLTSLWKIMGVQPHSCNTPKELNVSVSWPNRFWFDWDIDPNQRFLIDKILTRLQRHDIVPIWNSAIDKENLLEQRLIENNFEVMFEQKAMYLTLEKHVFKKHRSEHITRIDSPSDISTWTNISSQSFGYDIEVSVIHKIVADPDVQLLLTYSEGQAAATAMLYKTADIIGVHQIGVAEKYRGKGIAYSLMQQIIDICSQWQGKYITLQASTVAESLYKRLGFRQQFIIRNYQRVAGS